MERKRTHLDKLRKQIMETPKLKAIIDKVPEKYRDKVIENTYDMIVNDKAIRLAKSENKL